jgi:hypothetical protein
MLEAYHYLFLRKATFTTVGNFFFNGLLDVFQSLLVFLPTLAHHEPVGGTTKNMWFFLTYLV